MLHEVLMMSIASNVIDENTKLGTARTLLREKLSQNGISYKNSESIFQLLKRWAYTDYAGYSYLFYPDENEIREGNEVSAGVIIVDNDDNPVVGVPAEVTVNGTNYDVYSDSAGEARKTFTVGSAGGTLEITVTSGKESQSISYTIKSFDFEDNDEHDTSLYDVIKYPADTTHSLSTYQYDSGYNDRGYSFSKGIVGSSVVMLIPKGTKAIDRTTGVHFSAKIVQKKNSNAGWGDAITLVNSKTLSHYRDTKILELGAYPSKKGVKYSNSDHVVRELNTTSGQLALDST